MPTFAYVAYNGEDVAEGSIEGASVGEAIQALYNRGLTVISVIEQGDATWLSRLGLDFGGPKSPTDKTLISFTRRLSMLLQGGLPLLRALISVGTAQKPPLLPAIESVSRKVAAGKSLSAAMTEHPAVFPALLRGLLIAGESSGNVPASLKQYSEYLERQMELKRKVGGALIYPAIVLATAAALMVFMSLRVVPTFAGIFASLHLELPWITQAVVRFSGLLAARWPEIGICAISLFILISGYLQTEDGLSRLRQAQHALPLLGPLFDGVWRERLLSTLAMMLAGGVSLLQALSIIENVFADHPPYRRAIAQARGNVVRGQSIAASLKESGILSDDDIASISAAEEAGRLTESMQLLADAHRDDVDYEVRRLTTLIEPALILIVGIVAGVMMLSLFLPMAEMTNIRPQ